MVDFNYILENPEILGSIIGVVGVFLVTKLQIKETRDQANKEIKLLKKQHNQIYYSGIRPFLLAEISNKNMTITIKNIGNGVATNIACFHLIDNNLYILSFKKKTDNKRPRYYTLEKNKKFNFEFDKAEIVTKREKIEKNNNIPAENQYLKFEVLYTDIESMKVSIYELVYYENENENLNLSTKRKIFDIDDIELNNKYKEYITYVKTH